MAAYHEWENCYSLPPDEQDIDCSAEHEVYDDEGSSGDEIESQRDADDIGQALTEQGSCTLKQRQKKKGRKSAWSEENINEIIDVISENDYYRKKLISNNNKATKTQRYTRGLQKTPEIALLAEIAHFHLP